MSNLLVVAPRPLGTEARTILDNAIGYVEKYAGKWRQVDIEPARGSLTAMAMEARADAVMLLGTQLGSLVPSPPGVGLDPVHMQGILRTRGGGRQRWIVSPHPSGYSVQDVPGADKKSPVVAANLIGHLIRDLELLHWGHVGWANPAEPVRTRLVHNAETLREFMREIETARAVAIDTEATSLQRIGNKLLTIQMGTDGRSCWVLPVGHVQSPLESHLLARARGWLREYFESGTRAEHVYANGAFDLHQFFDWLRLRWYNHDLWDVEYGAFGLDENREARKQLGFVNKGDLWGLERLSQEHGMFHYSFSPVRKDERGRLASIPLRKVAAYGAIDGAIPLRMMRMQREIARRRNAGMRERPYARYGLNTFLVEGRKVQQITVVEHNGMPLDRPYQASLSHPDSPFQMEMRSAEREWADIPEVVEANRRVITASHTSGRSLWSKPVSQQVAADGTRQVFDIQKPDHQQMLLIDVCGLEPVSTSAKTGKASLNKGFKAKHRYVPIVRAWGNLMEARTMYGNFVASWHQAVSKSPDMRWDWSLRCHFDGKATTSRLKSSKPNSQNVPTRKKRSKIIKRQFVARRGNLFRKRDFSAHEVRVLAITARDAVMAERFWIGMQTRLKYEYQTRIPDPARQKWWREQLTAADVHYQNYAMMHGVDPLSVTKDQRNSIKVPIFKTTYGASVPTIGNDLREAAVEKLEDREQLARKGDPDKKKPPLEGAALDAELRAINREWDAIEARDWLKYAEELYSLIFEQKFKRSGDWIVETQKLGQATTLVPNILGGIRHLPGYLHPNRRVQRACDRRGPNAKIQGPASNIGLLAGWFLREMCWLWFVRHGVPLVNLQGNMVHDSTESQTSIVQIPLLNYLEHHAFTTRVHGFMRGTIGWPCNVGLESEVEVGGTLAEMEGVARWEDEVEAIRKGIQWGNREQGWALPEERLMRAVEHNSRIVHGIRRREIEHQLHGRHQTNYFMEMTERNARDYGWVHHVDIGPDPTAVVARSEAPARHAGAAIDWRNEL